MLKLLNVNFKIKVLVDAKCYYPIFCLQYFFCKIVLQSKVEKNVAEQLILASQKFPNTFKLPSLPLKINASVKRFAKDVINPRCLIQRAFQDTVFQATTQGLSFIAKKSEFSRVVGFLNGP